MNKETYNFVRWINKNDNDKKYHSYFEFFYDNELLYSDISDYVYKYSHEKNIIIDSFDENGIYIKKDENTKTIFFDMDGTFYNLYGFDNWLECILSEKTDCYTHATLLVDLYHFTNELYRLKKKGYKLGIISWLSKNASKNYQNKVRCAKYRYLKKYFPNLFDEIHIIQYGKNKSAYCKGKNSVLFDDEKNNRVQWMEKNGIAYDVINIIETLQNL